MAKVYAQVRFGEKPVLVFDTQKSARFNDLSGAGGAGRKGTAKEAAESYAEKLRGESHCNIVVEDDVVLSAPVAPVAPAAPVVPVVPAV